MRSSSSLKQEFLKKWILGLQVCSSSTSMSVSERKKAIKLSADIAMASARNGMTCWSRAIIANASKDGNDNVYVEHILGSDYERLKKVSIYSAMCNKSTRCKKILKKSRGALRKVMKRSVPGRKAFASSSVAKRMVKKRTQVLKNIVPGGQFMDEVSLIEETLDYILSLRAQIDVMRSFANASEIVNREKEQW